MRGVAPSKDGRRNEARWKKINKGDTALVLWRNYVRAVGEVVLRKESPELAKLMGSPKRRDVAAESAYRFVYFLRNLRSLEVPYAELNNKLGFKENNNFQAFDVLDTKKSQAVLELLRSKGAFDARSK